MTGCTALFVGADNSTGELNLKALSDLVSQRHESFTIVPGLWGVWRGHSEASAVVLICDATEPDIHDTISDILTDFRQYEVGVLDLPPMRMVARHDLLATHGPRAGKVGG